MGEQIVDAQIRERLDEVVMTLVRFARALNPVPHDTSA
jgi:hypothetical protein